jgi:hypothetical protein
MVTAVATLFWLPVCSGATLSRDILDVVCSNDASGGGNVFTSDGQFDDGRYINRIEVQGELELGAGWQLDPGYVGADDPALQVRPAGSGAFWWQTRDLDFGLVGALHPRWYLGDVAPILQHRPDALVELDLDARGGERIGVDMRGRFQLDSAQRFPSDRPDAWRPWSVPLWGVDMGDGLAPAQADLQPVVSFYPEPSTALELGASLELDQLAWLEPQRTAFGREPELRLAAGPVLGARFGFTPDLALVGRGQAHWNAWSYSGGTMGGWDWQAWGGLDGRVAPRIWLRVLAGYGGGGLQTADLDSTLGPGLLASTELELGREGPRSLAAGYRRGPLDLHSRDALERPYHYATLRYTERSWRGLEAWVEGAYRHQVAQSNELPAAAALARGQATYWLLDWLGVGAAGFYEQAMTVEDGLPREGLRFYGGYGVLKVGRVHTPSWRRPG